MTKIIKPTLIDSTDRLFMETDKAGKITEGAIRATQEIPDSFLRDCAHARDVQDAPFRAVREDVKIASLPAALVDTWYRNGFSIWDQNITPQDIINRLIAEGLTDFLCTTKSFG